MITRYCCGFLFNHELTLVALIRKLKPTWQAGKLNGIGGHIEVTDESPLAAQRREFNEEAGMDIQDWRLYLKLTETMPSGDTAEVYFFFAIGDAHKVCSMTPEKIGLYDLNELWDSACLPNVPWMVQMAVSFSRGERAEAFKVDECSAASLTGATTNVNC